MPCSNKMENTARRGPLAPDCDQIARMHPRRESSASNRRQGAASLCVSIAGFSIERLKQKL
jgi:hypothetical protein